jgi:GH15 family glucan-1,4-alpha-glucosidase
VPLRLEDYALIGDNETAALVGRDGSIDWLCVPRFDSGACFAALLGTREHGRWLIAPAADLQRTRRAYRGDTLVLETEFECEDGAVRLIDFLAEEYDPTHQRLVGNFPQAFTHVALINSARNLTIADDAAAERRG